MQLTKIPRKQIKNTRENVHVSLPMLKLGFFDVIGEIKRAARENKKNTKGGGGGGGGREKLLLEI